MDVEGRGKSPNDHSLISDADVCYEKPVQDNRLDYGKDKKRDDKNKIDSCRLYHK